MLSNEEKTSRMPPQAIDAEIAVLGSILIDQEAAGKAIQILDETCFYKDAHSKIFSCVLSLYERNEPIDLVTISNELEKRKELEAVGGQYFLTELVERIPSAANIEYYSKIVLDKALLRKLIAISNDVANECYEATESSFNVIDRAEQKIFSLSEKRLQRDFQPISPILHQTMEIVESFHGKKGGITGVPTGFTRLDEMTSGLQNSELIIIAGRPSMGKTAFALNIARNVAINSGIPTGVFSLEMASYQLAMRMLCAEARVDSHKVRVGRLPEKEWTKLTMAVGVLAQAPIYVDDTPAMNILEIRAKARRLKVEKNIGLLIVDYLQLIQGPARSENRQQEISMISQSLKALAKELDIPVVALSQLSRAVESRGGERRPLLSDLRESGALEQDADMVIFIYRPEVYGPVEREGVAEIIIGKQRNGPTGHFELAFINEYVQFANLADVGIDEQYVPAPF